MLGFGVRSDEVFGVSTEILPASYVNRGDLDARIQRLLSRNTHIALRGESKCGKSWLRQKNIPDALTVQCRLQKSVKDLYTDALSQLGLSLVREASSSGSTAGRLETSQELGAGILAKLAFAQSVELTKAGSTSSIPVGRDLDDLRFVSDIIKASGRRLVIEDFHYLSPKERRAFAFDLKALWDLGVYIVIIGIWSESNLLLHLNPDLAGRVEEVSIYWTDGDLKTVLDKGSETLNVELSAKICSALIRDSHGTVGILQKLVLSTLDEHGFAKSGFRKIPIENYAAYEYAAMQYAEQLNALYQTFANRVTKGIRQRKNSTGIYAHMLAVVMDADAKQLSEGLSTDAIYLQANSREPRVQKPNLRQILVKIDNIQVDDDGRGLILSYDHHKDEVTVVDKQLFLYRTYATARWPWEGMIEQADASGTGYEADNDDEPPAPPV